MFKRATRLAALALAIAAAGCSGSDGSQGPQGPQGPQGVQGGQGPQGNAGQDLTAGAKPESCRVCHATAGDEHQAVYKQYTDASNLSASIVDVQTVSSVTTVTFTVTYNGRPATAADFAAFTQKRFGAVTYDAANRQFLNNTVAFSSPFYAGVDGSFAVTGTTLQFAPETANAVIYGYLAANLLPTEGMALYSDVASFAKTYGTIDYSSTANVSGCERCHGTPYMKHGYRNPKVAGLADFVSCKTCHYDTRNGNDQEWQRLVDDPAGYAVTTITNAQKTTYAYKAKVMNDVHMSHAMEFAYPQSMANCATCHDGKLDAILVEANYKPETCRSCHPVNGPANAVDAEPGRAPALKPLMSAASYNHASEDLFHNATVCNGCHADANTTRNFKAFHSGYKKTISDAAGTKYSSILAVAIDSAVQTANTVTVKFTGTKTGGLAALDPTTVGSITPTVLVGLYGYDTKDFIVDAHGSVNGVRNLEWVYGATHPRFKNFSFDAGTGQWTVDVGLNDWATMLNSTVTRIEVAVLPTVKDPSGKVLAVNAPSKTFKLGAGALAEVPKSDIVDAINGCNKCHEALATTFHTPDRGGNVTVCRLCHNVRSGGFHLEMQSRSIDSYVHAIHAFQGFDIQSVDFTNPLKAMRYQETIESGYPNFTLKNCQSCHKQGTFNPPANDKSLPGVLSAAANIGVRGSWVSTTRTLSPIASNIGTVPSYVTGPASRACGACHRAAKIKENDAAMLNAFNDHTDAMGYMLTSGTGTLDAAIQKVMSFFR